MVTFSAIIQKFDKQGEKTGWTYIVIPQATAAKIAPGVKKSFRVKGFIDAHAIGYIALLPMGDNTFIMPLNAAMRKAIGKRKGASVTLRLALDTTVKPVSADFMECLSEEPVGLNYFKSLPPSHQRYFSEWIESAKTEHTKEKRIALAVNALARKMDFGAMLREDKAKRAGLK